MLAQKFKDFLHDPQFNSISESEKKYLICCLQSTLIENHKLRASNSKEGSNFSHDQSQDNNLLCESIQVKKYHFKVFFIFKF